MIDFDTMMMIIPFIICISGIGSVFLIRNVRKAGRDTDALKSAMGTLKSSGSRVMSLQQKLRQTLAMDPQNTGSKADEVKELLDRLQKESSDYSRHAAYCRSLNNEARKSLHKHVLFQNMFGGGANDLAALWYYKNEGTYMEAMTDSVYVEIDHYLLMRAAQYLNSHKDKVTKQVAKKEDTAPQNRSLSDLYGSGRAFPSLKSQTGSEDERIAANQLSPSTYQAEKAPRRKKKRFRRVLLASLMVMAVAVVINWKTVDERVIQPVADGEVLSLLGGKNPENALRKVASAISHNTEDATADTSAEEDISYQCVTDLNMREGPGTEYSVITIIPESAVCKATGNRSEDNNWVEMIWENHTGWVSAKYVE